MVISVHKIFWTQDPKYGSELESFRRVTLLWSLLSLLMIEAECVWIYIYMFINTCAAAFVADRTAGEVCSGVVNKCLNQRAKTKDLGMAVLMMYIEIEKQDIVQVIVNDVDKIGLFWHILC